MRTSALFGAKNFEFFETYVFLDKRERKSIAILCRRLLWSFIYKSTCLLVHYAIRKILLAAPVVINFRIWLTSWTVCPTPEPLRRVSFDSTSIYGPDLVAWPDCCLRGGSTTLSLRILVRLTVMKTVLSCVLLLLFEIMPSKSFIF